MDQHSELVHLPCDASNSMGSGETEQWGGTVRPQQPKVKSFHAFWRTSTSCFSTGAWLYIRTKLVAMKSSLSFWKERPKCSLLWAIKNMLFLWTPFPTYQLAVLTGLTIWSLSRLGADIWLSYSPSWAKPLSMQCNVTVGAYVTESWGIRGYV